MSSHYESYKTEEPNDDLKPEIDGNLKHRQAFINLFRFAAPIAVSYCCSTLANAAAYIFIGRYADTVVQAAHALAYSIGNILVLMVGLGLVNGMDGLMPVAIGGGHPEDTFPYLFQAFAVVSVGMVPLFPLVFFSKDLLILCHQEPHVSEIAATYLKTCFPGLFCTCIFESLRKFLIYHQNILVQMIFSIVAIPFQIFFLWIFVGLLRLEVVGAALARSLTWLIGTIVLLTFTYFRREDFSWSKYVNRRLQDTGVCSVQEEGQLIIVQETVESQQTTTTDSNECENRSDAIIQSSNIELVQSIDCKSDSCPSDPDLCEHTIKQESTPLTPGNSHVLSQIGAVLSQIGCGYSKSDDSHVMPGDHWWDGIWPFLKIAIPSTFLCIFEWLSFELQVIESGYLDKSGVELAALSTTQSFAGVIYFLSLSIGVTVNSLVGRAIGRLWWKDAVTITKAAILAAISISIPITSIVVFCRVPLSQLYSSSPKVQEALVTHFLFLGAAVVFIDSIHVILSGAVKALSFQWIASVFDFFGLLGIMQAVGIVLAFHTSLRGAGFWIGAACGLLFVDICFIILLFAWIDWPARAKSLRASFVNQKIAL